MHALVILFSFYKELRRNHHLSMGSFQSCVGSSLDLHSSGCRLSMTS